MAAHTYKDLLAHVGHKIECVVYGDNDNVAVECVTCGVVLKDFDKPAPVIIDLCPICKSQLIDTPKGGIKCSSSRCGYWFCY